ncbi:MAG: AAA family ATPase [Candidatus Marsarchaeota archaeon]|jgi:circadian clock protein KaiC|nr:AAA family ATPase [Candidatus Marsarchaeota archaeon]
MERVKTGIPGFDHLVKGGFPKGSTVLLSGTPGTGKSIFALAFIFNGAIKNEPGLYVTFEQPPEELKIQASLFKWDLGALEKKGLVKFLYVPADATDMNIYAKIEDAAKEISAKRLVIDSLGVFYINTEIYSIPLDIKVQEVELERRVKQHMDRGEFISGGKEGHRERFIYVFIRKLKDLRTTALVIADAEEGSESLTKDGVSEFASDGVITMHYTGVAGEEGSYLEVRKLRYTGHERGFVPFEIQEGKGMIVNESESTSILLK